MSPTARTLKKLRDDGWMAGVVEKRNPVTKILNDYLGCIDIIAVRTGETIGVQATSVSNQTSRVKKTKATPGAAAWLAAGNRLEIWGWGKRKVKRGGKAYKWSVTVTPLAIAQLDDPLPAGREPAGQ